MSDRRSLRFNGRVAHSSLRGMVEADHFTDGNQQQVVVTRTTVFATTERKGRERELIFGDFFNVLDLQDGMVFGYAERDGYAGWIDASALRPRTGSLTHRVNVRLSYAKATPELKACDDTVLLSFGAQVAVSETRGAWSRIAGDLWVPSAHLAPLRDAEKDPVKVAETFLGTPYLWGGNSALGIDCSGLVQAACLACGIACPGDSDQQKASLGTELPVGADLLRGDLLFWRGHVAWVADPQTLLHANAHHMAVAFEPLQPAISRIDAQGDGPVTAHKRL